MRNHRIVVTRHDAPDVLQVAEEDLPEPGPGEARLRVLVARISAYDLMLRRSGSPSTAPWTGGCRAEKECLVVG